MAFPEVDVVNEVCFDGNGVICSSGKGMSREISVKDSFGANIWSTTTSEIDTLEGVSAGLYTIVFDENEATCTQSIDVVVESEEVLAEFAIAGSMSEDSMIVFSNQSIHATSFDWDFGDNSTSTDFNPSHTYGIMGTYNVTLIAEYLTCSDTVNYEVFIDGLTNANQDQELTFVKVFPNPTHNAIKVKIPLDNEFQIVKVEILSVTGAIQQSWSEPRDLVFNVSNLSSGTYLLRVSTADETIVRSFIKE